MSLSCIYTGKAFDKVKVEKLIHYYHAENAKFGIYTPIGKIIEMKKSGIKDRCYYDPDSTLIKVVKLYLVAESQQEDLGLIGTRENIAYVYVF